MSTSMSKCKCVLLAWLLLAVPVQAETPAAPLVGGPPVLPVLPVLPERAIELRTGTVQPLRLTEAIEIALRRNPRLGQAHADAERAAAVVREQQAALFPTVTAIASYTYVQSATSRILAAQLASAGLVGSPIAFIETAPVEGQIAVNWTVFSSGLVGSGIRAAEASLAAEREAVERIRQELVGDVMNAYYDLQVAEGTLQIAETALRTAEANLKDTQAQRRIGSGTRFAVLQAQVQLDTNRVALLEARNRRTLAQRALARLLNFARPTDLTVADPVEQGPAWEQSLEESILEAYRRRPELAALLAQERSARAREEAAYAQTAPRLNVFAVGQTYDNLLDPTPGLYTGYSAGAQLQWAIFDGGAATARAEQAAASARASRLAYQDTLNQIRYAVETAYATLQTAVERIQATATAVESAEEELRLARLRFRAGVGTQLEVIGAERDIARARSDRLTAIVDFNRAVAALKRAVGLL